MIRYLPVHLLHVVAVEALSPLVIPSVNMFTSLLRMVVMFSPNRSYWTADLALDTFGYQFLELVRDGLTIIRIGDVLHYNGVEGV